MNWGLSGHSISPSVYIGGGSINPLKEAKQTHPNELSIISGNIQNLLNQGKIHFVGNYHDPGLLGGINHGIILEAPDLLQTDVIVPVKSGQDWTNRHLLPDPSVKRYVLRQKDHWQTPNPNSGIPWQNPMTAPSPHPRESAAYFVLEEIVGPNTRNPFKLHLTHAKESGVNTVSYSLLHESKSTFSGDIAHHAKDALVALWETHQGGKLPKIPKL
ncbi:MAG: hypothetical protein HEQ32_06805 [Vampirovibrio sp.]